MTALTAAYDAKRKDGELLVYPVAAGVSVYKGALVGIAGGSGFIQPMSDTAGLVFVGVAYENGLNAGGAAGALSVRVQKRGAYLYAKTSAVAADVGKTAFALDDNTASTAATSNNIPVGMVVGAPDAAHVLVRIDGKVN